MDLGLLIFFFTEFFRVHQNSKLDPEILSSVTENPSGRPVFAQLIGESINELCRISDLLQEYPIAGVDLNMGCPAPRVYKKNVGGGLLKDPGKITQISGPSQKDCERIFDGKNAYWFRKRFKF